MKKVKYALIGIFILGLISAIIRPKNKKIESSKVKTEKVKELHKEKSKNSIDLDNSKFWKDFDPQVKERVYYLIDNKDCKGLQEEFNITADNMDRLQNAGKSGSRNLELMNFIDNKLKELECYN